MRKKALERLRTTLVTAGAVAMASILGATGAFAATQGAVGNPSQGSLDITVSVPNLVRVTDFNDMSFDLSSWDGVSNYAYSDGLCVWSTTGAYNVTATGDGGGGAFEVASLTDTLPYTVTWADEASAADPLTTGLTLAGQLTSTTSTTCGGSGPTATVQVTFSATDLAAAPAGTYSGTLTVVVSPQ